MKALRTKICTYAIALLVSLGFTTPTFAGSSDFAGIWVAGHAQMNMVAIDGTFTDSDGNVSSGVAGGFAPTAGYEFGFNMPIGPVFFVTVGYSDVSGKARIGTANAAPGSNNADVTLHASDPTGYYIAPSISIFDNSAVYFKFGQQSADLKAIGNVAGSPNNIDGDLWAIGTTSIASNGLFFKTEAGAVQYDNFSIVGIGGTGDAFAPYTSTVEGDPLVGYGHISIGYKF
jgi:hypothetical protein